MIIIINYLLLMIINNLLMMIITPVGPVPGSIPDDY